MPTASRLLFLTAAVFVTAALVLPSATGSRTVDVLAPVFAVPAHIVTRFSDTSAAFAVSSAGTYVILDRREHAVYTVDASGKNLRRVLEIGMEAGRVHQPSALALASDDIIAIFDAPNGFDRIQYFSMSGMQIGGFYLPVRTGPRITIEGLLIDSADSLGFTGRTFLVNQPEWGALVAEFDINGRPIRQIGLPRAAPEADRDVSLAMNIGIPIADPAGGFFFVFQTGVPIFRKYDQAGNLVFERHIEGPELDERIRALPTTWASRRPGTKPVVSPLVRAAAADRLGRLWISLATPYTYVYDGRGEKVRTVQFQAAGIVSPSSFFFTRQGRLLVGPGGYEYEVE